MDKLFGLPVRLTAGGMSCDLIDAEMTEQSSNDQTKHIQANQQLGIIGSALEHQVLEQLFAQNGEQGFSAVKAIQLANEQGQKIYTITQENYQEIIPKLHLAPAAIADIRAAAQAGLTVTTHEKRIHVNGYTGEGYIILNERGTGAYMINGGMYGGSLRLVLLGTLLMAGSLFLGPFMSSIFIGAALGFVVAALFLINDNKMACFATTFMVLSILKKTMIPKFLSETAKLIDKVFSILSVSRAAKELCLCNVEPKCFP